MKIKTLLAIILLALIATACVGSKKASVTESKAGEQMQAADNETIPPGTVIKQTTGQIKFKVVPPEGSNTSVSI